MDGKRIMGSNIVDLIHHTVSPRKTPPSGSKEFRDMLEKLYVPNGLVADRKKHVARQSGGLFVSRKGRRDVLPGMLKKKKKRIQWMKY